MLVVQFSAAIIGHPLYANSEMGRFDLEPFTLGSRLAAQLSSIPGKHLVLEPIAEDNVMDSNHDLVWNLADIDHQRIVWARDLVPDWTAAAVAYYKDRTVWIVTGSGKAAHLERYPLERLPHPAQLSTLPMPDKQVSQ
jgi:hypothetical protein